MYMIQSMHMEQEGPALRVLERGAVAHGWSWRAVPHPAGPDGVLEAKGRRFVVELKAANSARGPELESLLADSALRAQAHARLSPDDEPLPIVFAPRLSASMLERLDRYALEFLPGLCWGAFDDQGVWHFPGLSVSKPPPRAKRRGRNSSIHGSGHPSPFSDLGQWLAKVLLAPRVTKDWLQAPRESASTLRLLAALSKVSLHSAARWSASMQDLGFLDSPEDAQDEPFRIHRVAEFLELWSSSLRPRRVVEQRVRSMAGGDFTSIVARLVRAQADPTLSLHSACDSLGVGIVSGAPQSVYLNSWSPSLLSQCGLAPAPAGGDFVLVLRQPSAPESLRRGRVQVNNVWCADVIQCYVDLLHYPVRGNEQAKAILGRLEWRS